MTSSMRRMAGDRECREILAWTSEGDGERAFLAFAGRIRGRNAWGARISIADRADRR